MSEGCEYCTGQWGGKVLSPENPMITVYVARNTLSVSTDDTAINYKINNCMMCGRKLEDDK